MKRLSLPSLCPASPSFRCTVVALAGIMLLPLAGCGGTVAVGSGGGTTPAPAPAPVAGYLFLTGNWQFQVTPDTGTAVPFAAMAGFINEQGQNPGNLDQSTAVFQAQPASTCYTGAGTDIPMTGNVQGTVAKYSSFSVNGQFFSLVMTRDTPGTHLTGTYKDSGGCSGSVTGTVSGVRYASLTGTYTGAIGTASPAPGVTLNVTQGGQGTGSGDTEVVGTGVFTGFTCFTKGTLDPTQSYVLGSTVNLTLNTNDPTKAQAVLNGTFDEAAQTITVNTMEVSSGSCSGSYGPASLAKQ